MFLELHIDGSLNFVALLAGECRYILSHPDQCKKLALYPVDHPSGRHSAIDWSEPDLQSFPEFVDAKANEVVMQAGDTMYLPTNWFHYIISLETNMQVRKIAFCELCISRAAPACSPPCLSFYLVQHKVGNLFRDHGSNS